MEHIIHSEMLTTLMIQMKEEEKSKATIDKYIRDVRVFIEYIGENQPFNKSTLILYKAHLAEKYELSSANSMLAAINYLFRVFGWNDCRVKSFKRQKEAFRSGERELKKAEYHRLLAAARQRNNIRLFLIMMTLAMTGIRISELPFITVNSIHIRKAVVSLKGKSRTIILPLDLCRQLKKYSSENGIKSGSIFISRNGKSLDRSNILHEMKSLCEEAEVERSKVFPHNFRHLFAVTYYQQEKDLCHLADILGHSNINTTRIYTLVSSEEHAKQIDQLGLFEPYNKKNTA